jgi:tripeptide aminopeptidase
VVNEARLLEGFLSLVRIDSPSGEEDAVAGELRARIEALGGRTSVDERGNLYAAFEGEGEPLLFSGHMDTVEPGRSITPLVEGDLIRTDGSTILGGDDKGGLAAILEGYEAARESGNTRAIELLFTRGEELGLDGAKAADFSRLRAREAVVFDGEGGPSKVIVEAPFILAIDGTVVGRSAHAGVEPEKGISALRLAMDLLAGFPQGRLDHETTANVGRLEAGLVRNSVPERCTFLAEVRSRSEARLNAEWRQLEGLVDAARRENPEARFEIDFHLATHGYKMTADESVVALVCAALRRTGVEPELAAMGGATDANVFAGHGIRGAVVGFGGENFHTKAETVRISQLVAAARLCEDLARA